MAQSQPTDSAFASVPTTRPHIREVGIIVAFYLLLFGLNALRVFLIYPWEARVSASGQAGDVVATLLELFVKGIFWIGLTFVFVRIVEKREFLPTVYLKGNVGMGIVVGIVLGIFFTVITIIKVSLHLPQHTSLFVAVPIVLAGPIEDIPFRGYIFKKFQEWKMPFLVILVLNSALFALIQYRKKV